MLWLELGLGISMFREQEKEQESPEETGSGQPERVVFWADITQAARWGAQCKGLNSNCSVACHDKIKSE